MFLAETVMPGIYHISDNMGVCFSLIEGRQEAVLFDTGYGLENVSAFIRKLTDKPLRIILSHGHHDHILGSRWFKKVFLCEDDLEEFRERTGRGQRNKVRRQAGEKRVPVPEDFMTFRMQEPDILCFPEKIGPFESVILHPGARDIRVIHVPGHTPGSIVMYLPEERLLLTGDNWNPCTWMWFPTSASAVTWRQNMASLLCSLEDSYGHDAVRSVLCSHQSRPRDVDELKAFISYMTDERLRNAPAADMGAPINTHAILMEEKGWQLVFDYDKLPKPIV